jgi:hypothetical protein
MTAMKHRHSRRRARSNPTGAQTLLIVGGVSAIGILGYLYWKSKHPTSTQTPMLAPPVAPPTSTPTNHHFGTNDTGSAVTLHPGDSVSFTFPNDANAGSTSFLAGKVSDWFYTIAPTLTFNGRTTQVVSGQLQETDTFTWGGGAGGVIPVTAQFLPANAPALPTSGPTPPVASPQTGASTFVFTINTVTP